MWEGQHLTLGEGGRSLGTVCLQPFVWGVNVAQAVLGGAPPPSLMGRCWLARCLEIYRWGNRHLKPYHLIWEWSCLPNTCGTGVALKHADVVLCASLFPSSQEKQSEDTFYGVFFMDVFYEVESRHQHPGNNEEEEEKRLLVQWSVFHVFSSGGAASGGLGSIRQQRPLLVLRWCHWEVEPPVNLSACLAAVGHKVWPRRKNWLFLKGFFIFLFLVEWPKSLRVAKGGTVTSLPILHVDVVSFVQTKNVSPKVLGIFFFLNLSLMTKYRSSNHIKTARKNTLAALTKI